MARVPAPELPTVSPFTVHNDCAPSTVALPMLPAAFPRVAPLLFMRPPLAMVSVPLEPELFPKLTLLVVTWPPLVEAMVPTPLWPTFRRDELVQEEPVPSTISVPEE